jgi:hypothetical protein
MIYEYRRYVAAPGKLPDVHARFEEHFDELFKRHGMHVVAYWQPTVGSILNELHYMLRFDDANQMHDQWGAFLSDPEFARVAGESERDGPLLQSAHNEVWVPTGYSPRP